MAGTKRVEGRGGGWYSPIKVMGVLSENFENTSYRVPESCFMGMSFYVINFYFSILFGYDNVANEFQTKEKQKLTEKKNSLQHVQNSFPPLRGTNPATTTHITCTANFNSTCV